MLGTLPLNLTTVRIVHIENKGNCHAYFKVSLDILVAACISKLYTLGQLHALIFEHTVVSRVSIHGGLPV